MVTASKSVTAFNPQSKPLKKPWLPHDYQKKAVKFLLKNHAAALFLKPGLGKTSITYAACKVLANKGVFKGALVIGPLRPIYSVWPAEKDNWDDFRHFSVGILHGDYKDDVLEQQHDFYAMNFEGIEYLFGEPAPVKPKRQQTQLLAAYNKALAAFDIKKAAWAVENKKVKARLKLLFSKVDVLIVDELSKMKHCDTKRFKAIKPYLGKFARRWGLTGSPAPNGLMDLFGQCYILDLGLALGPYITHFRNKYFHPSGFGGYTWALNEGAEEAIYAAVKPLALSMDSEDYLKMPTIIPVTIYVDLPPKARKMYDEMEDDLFTTLESKEFVAANAASASTKCAQIANGALYQDKVDPLTGIPFIGKREWSQLHTAKLDAMEELIGELQGSPILFAYHFGHDIQRIVKTLGKNTPRMDVSDKEVAKLIKAWNNNELAYLFGHPASMGHGLNLQEGQAQNVGWFNIPWDYEQYEQLIARVRRQGNKNERVFVYHIVARNTIDEAKMRAMSNKAAGQKGLLLALKDYRKGRK